MPISESQQTKSLSEQLVEMNKRDTLNLTDDSWVRFIIDHRELIIENSKLTVVSPEDMYRYRYRIRDFLIEKCNFSKNAEIVFRVINRLYNDMDFDLTISKVYIPDTNYLNKLRGRYATVKSIAKRLGSPF